jgi:hypothetical protein
MKKNLIPLALLIVAVGFFAQFLIKKPQTQKKLPQKTAVQQPSKFNPKRKSVAAPGRQSYTISQSSPNSLQFTQAVINPEDVHLGQKQTMSIAINDQKSPVTNVVAEIKTDTDIISYPLKRVSGTDQNGVWEGSWTVKDTHDSTYIVAFKATNKKGETGEARMSWTDPGCSNDTTPGHGTALTVTANCTVSGVDGADGGLLTISSGTITIAAGGTLVANDMLVSGGAIAKNDDSGVIWVSAGNVICMTDGDIDNYPYDVTQYADGAGCAPGRRRRYLMARVLAWYATTIDCGDANANAHPGQTTAYGTAFTNTATGLPYDYNCDTVQTQTWTAVYACNTAGCAAHYYTHTTGWSGAVPACGVGGTWYTANPATYCGTLNTCASDSAAALTQTCL